MIKYNEFFAETEQAKKIEKIQELFDKDINFSKEELNELINLSIDKKDIHVLSYCLSLDGNKFIANKEDLFISACRKNFTLGIQLLYPQLNKEKQYNSLMHEDVSLNILDHALFHILENDKPLHGMRFLINQGASLYCGKGSLLKYFYKNNDLEKIYYLIENHNLNIYEKGSDFFQLDQAEKNFKIKKFYSNHQYKLTQLVIPNKELPQNVRHKKI